MDYNLSQNIMQPNSFKVQQCNEMLNCKRRKCSLLTNNVCYKKTLIKLLYFYIYIVCIDQ